MTFNFVQKLRDNALLLATLVGILVGVVAGLTLKYFGVSGNLLILVNYPAELFIRAFQLVFLPIIIFNIISGSASLNIKENGKIAIGTFTCFLSTSALNAVLGIALAIVISPGNIVAPQRNNLNLTTVTTDRTENEPNVIDSLLDFGRNIIPDNLITPAFQQTKTIYEMQNVDGEPRYTKKIANVEGTNFIGLVSLCLVIGTMLSTMGEEAKPLLDLIKACNYFATKAMIILLWSTPVGVAFIICGKIAEVDDLSGTMVLLGWLILTLAVGILIDQFITHPLLYVAVLKKNPFKFYLNIFPALMMAFVTRSSAITLPLTIRCLDENVKADSRISHFVLPVGVTVNRNGTASFIAIASVFLAQLSGVALTIPNYLTIFFSAVAMSIAAGGPSGSLFVLQTLGIPLENIGLLFAIDWLTDRMRTMNNVMGDCYTVVIVERISRKKDKKELAVVL